MDSIVATQAIRVERAKENVEAARERMAEAMKERKMHETLREKAFEAFLQEENIRKKVLPMWNRQQVKEPLERGCGAKSRQVMERHEV